MYLLSLLLVAICNSFNIVVSRSQQGMKVSTLCGKDSDSSIQHNDCSNNWLSTPVSHHTTHPFMNLDVEEEGNSFSVMLGKGMILNC